MKRCPECRRDYYDDTLLYCLDDGNALLEGPRSEASGSTSGTLNDEARHTAILQNTAPPADPATVLMPGSIAAQAPGTRRSSASFTSFANSIAVLPFRNISQETADEYFSDGLTEEIISDLSKVRSLKVISRASSMKLKGTDKDSLTIAAELNVRYILDGSVRKAGEQIRISAQLIDGSTDENLWADKYSGTLSDIFEIQESVSRSIVEALKITLSTEEERGIEERPIENPVAYDLYLRARSAFVKGSPEALDTAIDLLEKGLEIIGDNELVLASLGYVHYQYFRWVSKLDKGHLEKAEQYMRRTFAHNEASPHGHVLKGLLAYSRGDMAESLRSLRKAVAIEPTNIQALFWLAINLNYVGACSEAIRYVERACDLDPLQSINIAVKGVTYTYAGRFDEAMHWINRSIEMDPNSPLLLWTAAIIEAWNRQTESAIRHFDRLAEIAPGWIYTQHGLFQKHAMLGQQELALGHNLPEMAEEAKYDCHFALHMAECFALIGDLDTAFDYLTAAVEGGIVNREFLTVHDAMLTALHGDERFGRLMTRATELRDRFLNATE